MVFNVKILNIETGEIAGNYGPQKVITVKYDYKGVEKSWKIFPSTYRTYPNLKESVPLLKEGQTVGFSATKVVKTINGFDKEIWEINAISAPTTTEAQSTGRKWEEAQLKLSKQLQKTEKKVWDNTGVKVGAARNQAIAFLAATKGTKFTLDDVDAVAYDIIRRQEKQEEALRSSKEDPTCTLPTLHKDNDREIAPSDEGQRAAHSYDDLDCDTPF